MSKSPYLFFYIIIYIYVLYSLRVCIYIYILLRWLKLNAQLLGTQSCCDAPAKAWGTGQSFCGKSWTKIVGYRVVPQFVS